MRGRSPRSFRGWSLAIGILLYALVVQAANGGEAHSGAAAPEVRFLAATDFLVLELTSHAPLTSAAGRTVRVYGDGRIEFRRPSQEGGVRHSEAWLTGQDLDALVQYVLREGMLTFDRSVVKEKLVRAQRRRERELGSAPIVLDAGTPVLKLHFEQLRIPDDEKTYHDIWREASWEAATQMAEWYPEIEELQALSRVIDNLLALGSAVEAAADDEVLLVTLPSGVTE
jgi:hypothetical protein